MKRRNFIRTASTTTAALISPLAGFSSIIPQEKMNSNFQLKMLATNWGFNGSIEEYCTQVKREGYDGIEIWWPGEKEKQAELFDALKKHSLEVGFLSAGNSSNFKTHLDDFKKMTEAAVYNNVQKPLYINCHSGKDYFSYEENKAIINYTLFLAKQSGVNIYHETHRSRMLYAAPVAKIFFETIPALRITFDVSHWCNVSESLLEDQADTLQLAIQHTDHIHARIGHAQGPQVNDPRAPEWQAAANAHFSWWDKIVAQKKQSGQVLTVLTEFGPADYMPSLPYTKQPVANQWDINVYMMQLFKKRYLNV